jgi:16S rRNA (uracil1498-N3)-methyltransferase
MSFIPRIFLPEGFAPSEEMALDEPTSRYLSQVLRLEAGAPLVGFDAGQRVFQMQFLKLENRRVWVRKISSETKTQKGVRGQIALGQSLPKAAKFDLILRQGTELGIHRFIPMVTQRSVSRPEDSQYQHKHDRWLKILVEACRQSGRNDVPVLDPIRDWRQTLELFQTFDLVLMPYEKEAPTLRTVLESHPTVVRVLTLVGPEGGWAPDEIQEARDRGAFPVHLPTPILRTETAGLVAAAMVQYELGERLFQTRSSD